MARGILAGALAIRWLTTAPTNLAAPTQANLTAGLNLIGSNLNEELAEIDGFMIEPSTIATPGYASNKVGNVSGDQTYPESRLSFYADDTVKDIWTALSDGTSGWIVFMDFGQGATKECETFPARVMSRARRRGRETRMYDVNFSIGAPVLGVQAA